MPTDRVRFTTSGRQLADHLLSATEDRLRQPQLVKIAILASLAEYGATPLPPEFEKTLAFDVNKPQRDAPLRRWGTATGDFLLYFIRQKYERGMSRDEALQHMELHLHQGLPLLNKFWHDAAGNFFEFLSAIHDKYGPKDVQGETIHAAPTQFVLTVGFAGDLPVEYRWNHGSSGNLNIGFIGASGGGKTQLALSLLAQVSENRTSELQLVCLDYKGDIASNEDLVKRFKADIWDPTRRPMPLNPFMLDDTSPRQVQLAAERLADLLSSLNPQIGAVQRNFFRLAVERAFEERAKQSPPFPDFRVLHQWIERLYEEENRAPDSLTEISGHLARMGYFATVDSEGGFAREFEAPLTIVDLHQIQGRRDEVAFFVLEALRYRMRASPEAPVADGWRGVRRLLFIDEAHHYLRKRSRLLDELLREGRSKGFGVWLATQSPDDLIQGEYDYAVHLGRAFAFRCAADGRSVRRLLPGIQPTMAGYWAGQIGNLPQGHCLWMPPGENERPQVLRAKQLHLDM